MLQPTPIKILHVVFSLEPGGMENGLVNVANALDPVTFEVKICCLERAGEFAGRLTRSNDVRVLGKAPGFSWRAVYALSRLISQIKPQILHSHNLGPLIYSGVASGFGRRCPILQGEHSLLAPEDCQPRRLRQRRWLYRCCRRIHTVSDGSRRELIGFGFPEAKITAVFNGVDTDRFVPGSRPAAKKRIGALPENAIVVGIVGRFGAFKQHDVLLEAFSGMAPRLPDVHLLIVGDGGPERDRVRSLAQASPGSPRIHFAGFQNDLPTFYQAMDLLVVPSINEGMSNAVLEGMACGVPVLANALDVNAEVIHHEKDGFICDLTAADQLRTQLEHRLADPRHLEVVGRAARETAVRRFSLTRMVQDYEGLYREVARQAKTKLSAH